MKRTFSLLILLVSLYLLCACDKETQMGGPSATIQVVEGQTITQLDDVSVYIGVSGESKQLSGLPAYTYSPGSSVSYSQMPEGRFGQVNHVFNRTDAAAFISYLNALEKDGWIQYSNRIIEGTNLFATYTKGQGSVYCYYISALKRACIISSPDQLLETREEDNQYTAVCSPILTQIKLDDEAYGMGYLLRLADGRFIVIDGGLRVSGDQSSQILHETMERQNVLDKPTVAAWILTHPHKDHIGTATEFLLNYKASQIEIQRFVLNFPTDAELNKAQSDTLDTSDAGKLPTFLMAWEGKWRNVPIIVCHTGQVYHFADAKIEILHTIEDYAPNSFVNHSDSKVNGSSVVFRVEVSGQKVMFYADANEAESENLVKMWDKYLKSDIMQANHHGLNGGSVDLYALTDPNVVMVPGATRDIARMLEYDYTRWIWNNRSGNIREVMLYDWEQRELELPYTTQKGTPYFSDKVKDPWGGKAAEYKD